jgi:hypothetical protein
MFYSHQEIITDKNGTVTHYLNSQGLSWAVNTHLTDHVMETEVSSLPK